MMAVNEVSQSIVNRMKGKTTQEVVVDPVTLTLVATIVTQIVKLLIKYIEYKKSQQPVIDTAESVINEQEEIAYKIVKSPSFWERWALKRVIRKQMGLFKYWWEGKTIYNAVLEEGRDTDIYTVKNLLRNN